MNKTLSLSGERSPNASLGLVSARLAIKYKLGASLGVQQTYKSKHDAAERLHQLVCEHWNAKDTVSRNLARWAPPSVADVGMIVLADAELKAAMKRIDPSMSLTKDVVWASAYVSAWQKLLDKKKVTSSGYETTFCTHIGVSKPAVGSIVWTVSEQVRTTRILMKWRIHTGGTLAAESPLCFQPSLHIFQEMFDVAVNTTSKSRMPKVYFVPLIWDIDALKVVLGDQIPQSIS